MDIVFWDSPCKYGTLVCPTEICICCQPLLFHHEYMTHYLQRQRDCHIHIKKITQWYNKDYLIRHVLLNDNDARTHIISHIKICLVSFNMAIRRQFIQSDRPLGGILSDLKIQPNFTARRFFKRTTPPCSQPYQPYPRSCQNYFGRFHRMLDKNNRTLADIYEWIA